MRTIWVLAWNDFPGYRGLENVRGTFQKLKDAEAHAKKLKKSFDNVKVADMLELAKLG